MGKSVVLKDLEHRPMGYVRVDHGSIICRARLDAPAQLGILFENGEWRLYMLDGSQEQRLPCDGARMRGCYVFREGRLLFVSDEAMHAEFARHMLRMRKAEHQREALPAQSAKEPQGEDRRTEQQEDRQDGRMESGCRERQWPQRRWPPPPCWETACYEDGCWRERTAKA